MEKETLTPSSSGMTRRKVIKGAAVVGGTVWVAPVIDSFVMRAAAASGPLPNSCTGCVAAGVLPCGPNSSCCCAVAADGSCQCIICPSTPTTPCTTSVDCPTSAPIRVNTGLASKVCAAACP